MVSGTAVENRQMNKLRYIFIFVLCSLLFVPKAQAINTEQEQQFTYYWYAARQAIDNERYPEAYTLLQFCNELKPDDAQTLFYLGVMQSALRHENEAKDCFERAYAADKAGASEELLDQLLNIYVHEEQWKKALAIRDAMDEKNGYDAMSALTRYRIYALQDMTKQAIKAVEDYLKTDPDNVRFHLLRLECLERTNAKKKVLYAQYERVLELDPYNLMVLNNYAYYLATHGGDLTKAEQMSAITIREQPDNSIYLDTYGWILHLKGQDELAKYYLNKALWSYQSMGNKEEIEKHLEAIK